MTTENHEITCQECFELLDHYADVLLAGGDPTELYPEVRQHLSQCAGCDHQFGAMITMLREATSAE